MTPEQRAIIIREYAKQKASGTIDQEALFALAGISTAAPSPAPQAPTSNLLTLADFAGDRPVAAPTLPPVDPGFVEQGGILGLAGRTPGLQQGLQGLGWAYENVLDPMATGLVTGVQAFIPGQQMLERVSDEAAQKARDEGTGYLKSLYLGSKAAGSGQFEQPITTGLGVNLPGEGIPLPDWLAGPDKRLDEIDIGRLASELPFEMIAGKGLGIATRPARAVVAARVADKPWLARRILPGGEKSGLEGERLKYGEAPSSEWAGAPSSPWQKKGFDYQADAVADETAAVLARNIEIIESSLNDRILRQNVDRINKNTSDTMAEIPSIKERITTWAATKKDLALSFVSQLEQDIRLIAPGPPGYGGATGRGVISATQREITSALKKDSSLSKVLKNAEDRWTTAYRNQSNEVTDIWHGRTLEGKTKVGLGQAKKNLQEAIDATRITDIRGQRSIPAEGIDYDNLWRTAGRNGVPKPDAIAKEGSTNFKQLRTLAWLELALTRQHDRAKAKLDTLDRSSGIPAAQMADELRLVIEARRKLTANNSGTGGRLYQYKDGARAALNKRYSADAGGITGRDVLAIAVQTGRLPSETKRLLLALADNLDDMKTRASDPKSPQAIEARRLMQETQRMSPETDRILGEVLPDAVDAEIAAEIAARYAARRKVTETLLANDNAAFEAANVDAFARIFAESRSNAKLGERSPASVKNVEPTNPDNPVPSGASDAAAHEQVPKGKYLTDPAITLSDATERLKSAPNSLSARLAAWVTAQRQSTDVGLFAPNGSLTAANLASTGGKAIAWIMDNTVGAVKPLLLKQNLVFRAFVAFAIRMQGIPNAKIQDVDNFFIKALGIEEGNIPPGRVEARIQQVFPVDPADGQWGNSTLNGWDVTEAYWAHLDFLKDPTTYKNKVATYMATRIQSRKFFANKSIDQASAEFDNFLGIESRDFLRELKIFNEEIREAWKATLTPEELTALNKSVSRGLDTAIPRQLLARQIKDGEVELINGSATLSTAYQRAFDEVKESVAAGYKYDFNIRNLLQTTSIATARMQASSELRKIMLDADLLVTSGLNETFGLSARMFSYFLYGEGKGLLKPSEVEQLRKFENRIKAAEVKLKKDKEAYPDNTVKGYDAAINKINKARDDTILRVNKALEVFIKDGASSFAIPSKQWWINHTDGYLSRAEFLKGFGVSSTDFGAHTRIASKAGLTNVDRIQESVVKDLEDSFKLLESIVFDRSLNTLAPGKWTMAAAKVGNFWRLSSTGFDFAFPLTVGFPLLFRNPGEWAKTSWAGYKAFIDPDVMRGMIERDPSIRTTIREMADAGIPLGDMEVYLFLKKTPDGTFNVDIDSYVNALTQPPKLGAADKSVVVGKRLVSGTANRFQRSYNTGAMLNRIYWYRAMKPAYTRIGPDGNDIVDNIGLRDAVSNTTAVLNITGMGRSVTAKQWENLLVGLSPRLTRSIATLVLDAQRGAGQFVRSRNPLELAQFAFTQGRKGKSPLTRAQEQAAGRQLTNSELAALSRQTRELLALGNLSTTLLASGSLFYMLNYTKEIMSGATAEEAKAVADASVDPRQGKKFLSVEVNGAWIGIGGFWRSLAGLNWQLIYGAMEATQGNYAPLEKFKRLDRFDNPLIATYMNRGAPAIEFGGKAIEGITGTLHPGMPVDAAPYDIVDNVWDLPISAATSFAPFSIQGIVDGEGKEAFFFGMLGGRTGKRTASDAVTTMSRRSLNIDVDNSRDIAESWIKRDVLYPLVDAQYGISARASNSSYGIYTERKAALEVDFFNRMMKEYAAGAKDYDLLSFYYDERKLLSTRMDELERVIGLDDFRVNPKDPIAVALKEWREIYDSPEVVGALKDQRWDFIEAARAEKIKDFTQEQKDAVLRSGSGIPLELLRLLNPDSQARYLDLLNRRQRWIVANAKTPEIAKNHIESLKANMFPVLGVPRGLTPVSTSRSRSTGSSFSLSGDPQSAPSI